MFSIFKLGHCEIQIRPLRVKVGQHPRKGAQVRAFGPAGLRRRVLLCLLLCAVCWRCSSSRYFWSWPENLAVQRCSNLLSRSRGMLLITKAPGLPSPRGFKGLNARDPLKVHHNGSWALGSLTRNQRLAPGAMAGNDRHMTACIANAPAASVSFRPCELRHITLPRIDLHCRRFLPDWDPSPMAGSF
jgi:hypothetical protein